MSSCRVWIFFALAVLSAQHSWTAQPNTLTANHFRFTVEKAPDIEKWFDPTDAWGGADGVFSIPLDAHRLLFTFGDTFTTRQRRKMVNNSIAILRLEGRTPAGIDFFFGQTADGAVQSFAVPQDNRGVFWLAAGVRDGSQLHLFAAHIELTSQGGPFGFRQIGESLLTVDNPDESPPRWQIRQQEIPYFRSDNQGSTVIGSATLDPMDGPYIYLYGFDEEKTPLFPIKHAIAARVEKGRMEKLSEWEFYCGPAKAGESDSPDALLTTERFWTHDFARATRLAREVASEYSVSYLPVLRAYVMVYTRLGLSQEIVMRSAPTPVGPWSAPLLLYRIPDVPEDIKAFFYAAKAHPALAADDELVVSYVANSFDFARLVRNPDIYRPRFIRVKFTPTAK
ncbi:DUF4185 domain-containing protein [Thermogutta sp.]|uniref:DUF4185 domain-containing protein n=1 Tax=Thermogutta sp. TaxID=1962930 RepID=UPI003C7E0B15